jgi:hypothetical protein
VSAAAVFVAAGMEEKLTAMLNTQQKPLSTILLISD